EQLLDLGPLAGDALLREVVEDLLRLVDEVARLAGALPAQARDLPTGADERRELVQPDAAADGLELGALLQLVGERDRVDGLALRVQPERSAIDLRVRLAVEVARVHDLADRPDRPRRDHHRPEHALLRFQILGRNWRRNAR